MKLPERRQLGRRKSDWVMPILLWMIAFAAILTARHFWMRANDLEELNETLQQQVTLLQRTPTPPKPAAKPTPHR